MELTWLWAFALCIGGTLALFAAQRQRKPQKAPPPPPPMQSHAKLQLPEFPEYPTPLPKRVLVTGAAGGVGQHIVRMLKAHDVPVIVGLDLRSSPDTEGVLHVQGSVTGVLACMRVYTFFLASSTFNDCCPMLPRHFPVSCSAMSPGFGGQAHFRAEGASAGDYGGVLARQARAQGRRPVRIPPPPPRTPPDPPKFSNPSFSNLGFWGKGSAPKAPNFFFFALPEGVFVFFTLCVYTQTTQNFVEKSKMFEKHKIF